MFIISLRVNEAEEDVWQANTQLEMMAAIALMKCYF